jgi:hypothetical protein
MGLVAGWLWRLPQAVRFVASGALLALPKETLSPIKRANNGIETALYKCPSSYSVIPHIVLHYHILGFIYRNIFVMVLEM